MKYAVIVAAVAAVMCASGASAGGSLSGLNLALTASEVRMDSPDVQFSSGSGIPRTMDLLRSGNMRYTDGQSNVGRQGTNWTGYTPGYPLTLDPYFTWTEAQDIRVLRLWGCNGNYGSFTQVSVDVWTANGWEEIFDSSAPGSGYCSALPSARLVDIDLGDVYSTTGLRIRTEMSNASDGAVRRIGQVQIFGDLGGDFGQGAFNQFRVAETTNSWAVYGSNTSSMSSGAHAQFVAYAVGDDRWLSETMEGQKALSGMEDVNEFYLGCSFTNPETINALEICWRNGSDSCLVPLSWNVLYQTGDDVWKLAGTYYREENIFSTETSPVYSGMYFCDLRDADGNALENVKGLRIEVPFDQVAPGTNRVGVFQVGMFNIPNLPPVPEPATMTLLALGGVVLLRRRHRGVWAR